MVGHIGAEGSAERRHGDWVLDEIVRPAIETAELVVERADNIAQPGMIDGQIIRSLLEADLVVADLSMLNPNVLYEIGIRHMAQKPIVHMYLTGQSLPFDLRQFRSIEFSMETPADMRSARERLRQQAIAALGTTTVDNPVTVAMGLAEFERTASAAEQVLAQQVAELSQRIETLELRSIGGGGATLSLPGSSTSTFGQSGGLAGILMGHWDGKIDKPPAFSIRLRNGKVGNVPQLRTALVEQLGDSEVALKLRGARQVDVFISHDLTGDSAARLQQLFHDFGYEVIAR